jgi:hypothetical protein
MYSIDGGLGCNGFNRLQRCYECRNVVIDAFCDLADAIITVRNLIGRAWTTHRWNTGLSL